MRTVINTEDILYVGEISVNETISKVVTRKDDEKPYIICRWVF